jgi:hypothetical protein
MSLTTIAQLGSAIAQLVFIVVVGLGYWYTFRLSQRTLEELRDQRADMGRPLVVVYENLEKLPNVELVVYNVGSGPARDISFEFSAPVVDSDGFVLSDLPIFRRGLAALAPGSRITCYWDRLDALLFMLREQELADHIRVITRYRDLTGDSYETRWDIEPAVYEGIRNVERKDMTDLVDILQRTPEEGTFGAASGQEDARSGREARSEDTSN